MKNKKFVFLVVLAFMVSGVFISATFTSNGDQAVTAAKDSKMIRRSGFSLGKMIDMTAGISTWTKVNQVTVKARGRGYVYVVAHGDCNLAVGPNSVTVGIADQPNVNCIWHYTMGTNVPNDNADRWHAYSCSWVFEVPAKGEYTYYLNACSLYGDGTSEIFVANGVLSATWIDHKYVTYYDF
jgi:hypothetical protein